MKYDHPEFERLPEGYDRWTGCGNDEWAYANILPYFRKMENDRDFPGNDLHGNEGPLPVRRFTRGVGRPPPAPFMTPTDGFVSLMGRLTVFVSDITMAFVEDGALLWSRQLDRREKSGPISRMR